MPVFSEGNIPYGAQVVTIGVTGYVAENATYTEPSTLIERRNENGEATGQVAISGFGQGSMTLQLATSVTQIPTIGATFTFTRNGGSATTPSTIGCFISETGETQGQLDIRKVNVNFRRRYNS